MFRHLGAQPTDAKQRFPPRHRRAVGVGGLGGQRKRSYFHPIMKPAIFLDRDGVINENRSDYVKSWDEYQFLPNVFTPLKRLAQSDYLIVVISNQSPIGRGIVPQAVIEEINACMKAEIERHGGRIDAIYYCPHTPDDECDCRKPQPGMFLRAAKELGIDLSNSFFIGDAVSDVEAAFNAGCKPIYVLTGLGAAQLSTFQQRGYDAKVPVVKDLAEAVELVLGKGYSAG